MSDSNREWWEQPAPPPGDPPPWWAAPAKPPPPPPPAPVTPARAPEVPTRAPEILARVHDAPARGLEASGPQLDAARSPDPPEPEKPRAIPPLFLGLGIAALVGIALVVAALALPKGTPPPVDPPPVDPPPPVKPPDDTPAVWPTGEPLLARLPVPWDITPGLLDGLPPPSVTIHTPPPPDPPPPRRGYAHRRMSDTSEDELRRGLEAVPELALYKIFPREEARLVLATAAKLQKAGKWPAPAELPARLKRPEFAGLPFRSGAGVQIADADASRLAAASTGLRAVLRIATPVGGGKPDAESLGRNLLDAKRPGPWMRPETHSVMVQLMMGEDEPTRLILARLLATVRGPRVVAALASRALFDPAPRVREAALKALDGLAAADYLPTLLAGLDHPWPPAVRHAAEALASLDVKEAIPALQSALQKPDPGVPFVKPGKGLHVREMVRVNRHRNCLLCHPQSISTADKVRAACPTTDRPLDPFAAPDKGEGVFVRADVAYLRQEFAASLRVERPGLWPEMQAFDFLVRERPANAADSIRAPGPTERQRALMFALKELTGKDAGADPAEWAKLFFGRDLEVKTWHVGFKAARAVAVVDGKAHVADSGVILRKEGDARPVAWHRDEGGVAGLADDGKGGLLAACGKGRHLSRLDPAAKTEKVIATGPGRERFASPRKTAADGQGGAYVCDGGDAAGAVYHVSALGVVAQLKVGVTRPRGVAADGKTLYVVGPGELWAYDLEAPGLVANGRRLAKLDAAADVAVCGGLVCVLEGATRMADVYGKAGHRVARARLPDAPVACCAVGRTLYVLTRTALMTADLTGVE